MPSPLTVINLIIVGFGLAGACGALRFAWVHRSWTEATLFMIMSLALAGHSLSNQGLQSATDPATGAFYFTWLDVTAFLFVVSLPYLFRKLMDQRVHWFDHLLASSMLVSLAVTVLRPQGFWNSLDAMEPVDLGWLGVIHEPRGDLSWMRIGMQFWVVALFAHCLGIAWRGRKTHKAIVRWLIVLPGLLIPTIIYHLGLFRNWWRGPLIGAYVGVSQYLALAASIWVREYNVLVDRDRLFHSLEEREAKLSALANFSIGFAGLLDPEGRVVLANHASLAAINVSADAVIGKPFPETPWWTHDPAQQERLRAAIAQAARGQADRFQATHRDRHGETITVDFSLTPYYSEGGAEGGTLRYLIAEGRDITALVKYQERLREGNRLEAVGQLAGGVAHDFNNVLGAIMGAAELALLRAEKQADVREHLGMILRSTNRAADLTRNLLSFARRGKSQELNFSVNSLIRDTLAVLARTLGPAVRIEARYDAQPDQVRGDPAEIQAALLNLCLNARDAMPQGGKLTVRTGAETLDSARGEQLPQPLPAGRYITIVVSDTGEGIPTELQGRIFEPFFTTKPAGRGTGLGLAAVLGAVQAHRGAIEVASTPGAGASFTLYLPADGSAGEAAAAGAAVAAPTAPQRRGHAVVVDDEALVRELTAEMLRQLGYEVQTFRDPVQARKALTLLQDLRLVVLDLAMPNLDGVSLYREIRREKPDVAVIIATGFAGDRLQELDDPHLATLAKPFRLAQLSDALTRLGL